MNGRRVQGVTAQEFKCECVQCSYRATYNEHCNTHTCPKCGARMRRQSRPGRGMP